MPKLLVFESVSVDGYFTDRNNDLNWAHAAAQDPEWIAFVSGNASGNGRLLFGRVTYQQMASFWPTPQAAQQMPAVAAGMNRMPKVVFSRTLTEASWQNTTLIKDDLTDAVRKLKQDSGPDMCILGSGTIVAQLSAAGLVDAYQIVVVPVVLGAGRTLFDSNLQLKLTSSRAFGNGNVVNSYEPRR